MIVDLLTNHRRRENTQKQQACDSCHGESHSDTLDWCGVSAAGGQFANDLVFLADVSDSIIQESLCIKTSGSTDKNLSN